MGYLDRRVITLSAPALLGCAIARAPEPSLNNATADKATAPTPLVGRWRVIGCETSPQDPANCADGEIVFTTDHVTVDVPEADKTLHVYKLVSTSADHILINVDGEVSEIALDANGDAHWHAPGVGSRVGRLMFVRERK